MYLVFPQDRQGSKKIKSATTYYYMLDTVPNLLHTLMYFILSVTMRLDTTFMKILYRGKMRCREIK